MPDENPPADYETTYKEFWKDLVEKDGAVNMDALMRELHDYRTLMHNATAVYCHVTGNRISKLNTASDAVISVADDVASERLNEALQDGRTIDTHAVQHFLTLAKKGRIGAASGGEKRAFRVATKLPALLDDVPGIDSSAVAGIVGLIQGCGGAFETVMDLLERNGFKLRK